MKTAKIIPTKRKVRISISLDPDVYKNAKKMSSISCKSISQVVERALKETDIGYERFPSDGSFYEGETIDQWYQRAKDYREAVERFYQEVQP